MKTFSLHREQIDTIGYGSGEFLVLVFVIILGIMIPGYYHKKYVGVNRSFGIDVLRICIGFLLGGVVYAIIVGGIFYGDAGEPLQTYLVVGLPITFGVIGFNYGLWKKHRS